jgi:hypothetical protein
MREMAIGNIVTMTVLWAIIGILLYAGYETLLLSIFLVCNGIMTALSLSFSIPMLRAPKVTE